MYLLFIVRLNRWRYSHYRDKTRLMLKYRIKKAKLKHINLSLKVVQLLPKGCVFRYKCVGKTYIEKVYEPAMARKSTQKSVFLKDLFVFMFLIKNALFVALAMSPQHKPAV